MSELIDTTEMYLRTIYELIEEGVFLLRARIAERLHHSGPTVSQTVARMERDGLLCVGEDRQMRLSSVGFDLAEAVMRKHRLSECLLTNYIGLDWELAHEEACRWEHVISDEVEIKLVGILKDSLNGSIESPYGNPIPGLGKLGVEIKTEEFRHGADPFPELLGSQRSVRVRLRRIGESVQAEPGVLSSFAKAGVRPGEEMDIQLVPKGYLLKVVDGLNVDLSVSVADKLFGCLA